jgi:hypothetical protein
MLRISNVFRDAEAKDMPLYTCMESSFETNGPTLSYLPYLQLSIHLFPLASIEGFCNWLRGDEIVCSR